MSVSRDDFGIAFRSALLQRGATQKFSIGSLIILAIIIFFLDVYGLTSNANGENNKIYMCDNIHLSPKCLGTLFENHLYKL